jgi:hypothetical protein
MRVTSIRRGVPSTAPMAQERWNIESSISLRRYNGYKERALLRSITLYGATGGLKFWRYDLGQAKWISQIG